MKNNDEICYLHVFIFNSVNQSSTTVWHIPFSHSIQSKLGPVSTINSLNVDESNLFDQIEWITTPSATLKLNNELNDDQFLLVNLDMAGFYRVNYDEKSWQLIIEALAASYDVTLLNSIVLSSPDLI